MTNLQIYIAKLHEYVPEFGFGSRRNVLIETYQTYNYSHYVDFLFLEDCNIEDNCINYAKSQIARLHLANFWNIHPYIIEVQEKIVNPKILVICPIIEMTNKTILYPDFIDGIPITYCNCCED